jgi:diaminohydroxyphosphoribosylaminopyrimidine deaminase/5-amino-6-(5-phosphoribosylamino)uracil reductase
MQRNDADYMRLCLELASNGYGYVAPNPMVGCVITESDKIIAQGWHKQFGAAHAERDALMKLKDRDLRKATLYVNLEPCNHYGKTPPCTLGIIESGIKKVVVGCTDPNLKVKGKGIELLREHDIEVVENVLEKECRFFNRRFFTYHKHKRPYIILKWAQTFDGFVSKIPVPSNREDNLITGVEAQAVSHSWRSEEQAISVGKYTVLADNPYLTVRYCEGKNPLRVIIDSRLEIPSTYNIFNHQAPTLIINRLKDDKKGNIEWVKINEELDFLDQFCSILYDRNILSVIIEGGSTLLEQFIYNDMWDEARVFEAPKLFNKGISAPDFDFHLGKKTFAGKDALYICYNTL